MPRWLRVALLVAGVLCAAAGAALVQPRVPVGSSVVFASYAPEPPHLIVSTAPIWAVPLGTGLLALGAGTSGAALVAVLMPRRPRQQSARAL